MTTEKNSRARKIRYYHRSDPTGQGMSIAQKESGKRTRLRRHTEGSSNTCGHLKLLKKTESKFGDCGQAAQRNRPEWKRWSQCEGVHLLGNRVKKRGSRRTKSGEPTKRGSTRVGGGLLTLTHLMSSPLQQQEKRTGRKKERKGEGRGERRVTLILPVSEIY